MIIRWLCAFRGKGNDIVNSLDWELTQKEREVAAEDLRGNFSGILAMHPEIKVGVLINKKGITRKFKGDVWSITNEKGLLVPTRKANSVKNSFYVPHTEVFIKPGFISGIVIIEPFARLNPSLVQGLKNKADQYDLPIYLLKGTKIELVY